jgi:hypothetical protein
MSEWDHRQLCPDGNCVGVIGSDGTCKVCGRAAPNWGDERKRGMVDEPDEPDQDEPSSDEDHGPVSAPASEGDPDWDERKLCPDDGCIGVIGDDGHCKVCGRSAA